MFLENLHVIRVDVCVQQAGKFTAQTRANQNLSEILPYLNAIIPGADYNPHANSLKFTQDKIDFTILQDQVNLQKFCNRTEMMELLDWFQDLANDTYDSRAEITPRHTTRKKITALMIYSLLPKTNCKECGEQSCMTFASKLYQREVELADCPELFQPMYSEKKNQLEKAFA